MTKIDSARNPLRRARLAAGLELHDLEKRTRISPAMLRYIDAGEFHRLPAGIYARAWVRSVAVAVGLHPEDVLRDLDDTLPKAAEIGAQPAPPPSDDSGQTPGAPRTERFTGAVPSVRVFDRWRRSAAAVLDGIFLSSISIAVWIVTATASGTDPNRLGPTGIAAIAALTLAIGAAYFVLFAGIGGRTPGAALLSCPVDGERVRLDLAEIGRRAAQAALQESSIVVDLASATDLRLGLGAEADPSLRT